jgi:hypothetical protein
MKLEGRQSLAVACGQIAYFASYAGIIRIRF